MDFDDPLVEIPYRGTHENQSKKFIFADLEMQTLFAVCWPMGKKPKPTASKMWHY